MGLERCQSCSTAVKGRIRAGIKAKKPNQALCPSRHFQQETTSKAAAPELKSTGLKLSTWSNHILQMHPEKSNQCKQIPAGHQKLGWLLSWLCQGHREPVLQPSTPTPAQGFPCNPETQKFLGMPEPCWHRVPELKEPSANVG